MISKVNQLTIIQSAVFARHANLRFGISTRQGGVSPAPLGLNLSFNVGDNPDNVRENRALFYGALGIPPEAVAYPGQVHSGTVYEVAQPGKLEACDALTTNRAGLFLAVSIADCIPIFLYDPMTQSVAAIHSGWRGSRAKIGLIAVRSLEEKFRADPQNLIAFIGPGAGVCCYEVGEEVASKFAAGYVERKRFAVPHLDLKAYNRDLLVEAGLLDAQIEVSDACTICGEDLYHSYRRDGKRSGRMLGVIGMAEGQISKS